MTSERIDQAQRVLMHEFNQFDKELQARISTLRGHLDNVVAATQKQIDSIGENIAKHISLKEKALEWNLNMATKNMIKSLSDATQFRFLREGDWVKVYQRGSTEPTRVLIVGDQLYCGRCSENPCIHVKAVRSWLAAKQEAI
jgi:Cu/Ag efflux protein CusF